MDPTSEQSNGGAATTVPHLRPPEQDDLLADDSDEIVLVVPQLPHSGNSEAPKHSGEEGAASAPTHTHEVCRVQNRRGIHVLIHRIHLCHHYIHPFNTHTHTHTHASHAVVVTLLTETLR